MQIVLGTLTPIQLISSLKVYPYMECKHQPHAWQGGATGWEESYLGEDIAKKGGPLDFFNVKNQDTSSQEAVLTLENLKYFIWGYLW